MNHFIEKLKAGLNRPLPGREAQFRMAHVVRRTYMEAPSNARRAAVLALFYPKDGTWHIVLIERTSSNPKDRHSGQISFPGGSFDLSDASLWHTALREAEEEIGVNSREVQALGSLTDLYIPVSNFHVFPFVGFLNHTPQLAPQAGEVEAILETPFSIFLEPSTQQYTEIVLAERLVLKDVPCFMVDGRIVWGATAMILSELSAVLEAAGG